MQLTSTESVRKMVDRLGNVLKNYGYRYSEELVYTYKGTWVSHMSEFCFVHDEKDITFGVIHIAPMDGRFDQFNIKLSNKSGASFSIRRYYSLNGPIEYGRYFIRIPEEFTLEAYLDQFYYFVVEVIATDFNDYLIGRKEIVDLPIERAV